ncbi:hypothetical protein CS022_04565 [Veronia nyctiphanis]|uniref:TspB protein n=2 Tax=Veronia nyctiphanis TaxID=1278244 RepID=A0A4V1LT86_9GAMM|nr:hypothetical protein CS022_04565 [Veronia nyctiphanis]
MGGYVIFEVGKDYAAYVQSQCDGYFSGLISGNECLTGGSWDGWKYRFFYKCGINAGDRNYNASLNRYKNSCPSSHPIADGDYCYPDPDQEPPDEECDESEFTHSVPKEQHPLSEICLDGCKAIDNDELYLCFNDAETCSQQMKFTGETCTSGGGSAGPGTGEPGTGEPGTGEPGTGEPGTGTDGENRDGEIIGELQQANQTLDEMLGELQQGFCEKNEDHESCQEKSAQAGMDADGKCQEFKCQGDAVTCELLRVQHMNQCLQPDTSEAGEAVSEFIEAGDFENLISGEADFSTFQKVNAIQISGNCPAPIYAEVMGETISFSFEPVCDAARLLRPFVIALGYIIAALMVGRGLGGA